MSDAKAQGAGYDGTWSVLVITDKGECDRAYRYPVRIRGGKVGHTESGSSFNIGGRVGAGGAVKVFVSPRRQARRRRRPAHPRRRRGQVEIGQGRVFRTLDSRTPRLKAFNFQIVVLILAAGWQLKCQLAGATGLEPAASGVTGRRSNQLSYAPIFRE